MQMCVEFTLLFLHVLWKRKLDNVRNESTQAYQNMSARNYYKKLIYR